VASRKGGRRGSAAAGSPAQDRIGRADARIQSHLRASSPVAGWRLGYHVTLVEDATAAFSPEAMHAARVINGPTFAHAIVTTEDLIPQLSA
jgi:nicotinamidase-related amidase